MIELYHIPFVLFIIGAYIYYTVKNRDQKKYYKKIRDDYLRNRKDITPEQSDNLSKGIPWQGMDSSLLITLFGEPRRKRVLDQSLTKTIWSYADLFVYLDNGIVIEWKSK